MTEICKTTTLSFRIKPMIKEALRTAASLNHRSLSNMVEMLIRDYCQRNGIGIKDLDDTCVNEKSDKV